MPNLYYCMEPYSTDSHSTKNISAKNSQKHFLRNRAHFSRKMCPLCYSISSLKHTQKISLTLLPMSSQTFDMSCTLPNAFFYNLKMTFSPQKCLFTFPNPRSKGQDQILHFSRSRVIIHSLQNVSFKIKVNFTLLHKCFMKIKSL